jgi:poly(A) polymerase
MNARLDPAKHSWMTADETATIMRALRSAGGEARFVGGAVRNAMVGESVTDIDIATTLSPDAYLPALKNAGVVIVPTGIEHGTITAIANGQVFEITSLREDVSTDGRRAKVVFTTDWAKDAARRDFTMNAIYADMTGQLFDFTGGIADLRAGRVKFVGDPNARIREDYLRILRFFRFHAWYGRSAPDEAALDAAARNKTGLKRLSGERIRKELLRLLEADDPGPALRAMQSHDILGEILPLPVNLERLSNLIALARQKKMPRGPMISLAALLSSDRAARTVASDIKLSNVERAQLVDILSDYSKITPRLSSAEVTRLLYRFGKERFSELLLLAWAEEPADSAWEIIFARAKEWAHPDFPIDGADVMEAGAKEGPTVGRILSALESWWVEEDFAPDRAALLAKLKDLVR